MPSSKFLNSVDIAGNETVSGSEYVILDLSVGNNLTVVGGVTANNASVVTDVSAAYFYGNGSNLTNLNASNITSGTLSAARLPVFNGDITTTFNSSVSTTVIKIQGQPISTATPVNGQMLQYNGTAWVPASVPTGGSGGGGLTFFLNQGLSAQSPTTNLPLTAHELGRTALSAQTTYTSPSLSQVDYSLITGFVSDVLDPDTTAIPAGLWDFNVWGYSNANANNPTLIRALVYKYDGANAPTLLATSDDTTLVDGGIFYPLVISCLLTQTPLLTSDRIYVEFRAKASAGTKTVTLGFGDSTPTHVHTTLPSVGGSGLVKVVNGVFQNPASLLVDVDVDANAAIAQSKISGLATALAGKVNTNDVIAISAGGTGQTNAAAALSALGSAPLADVAHFFIKSRSTSGVNRAGIMNTGVTPNTFTFSTAGALLSTDYNNYLPTTGDVVLFLNQTTQTQNGPWAVTDTGSPSTSALLIRPSWFSGAVRPGMLLSETRGLNHSASWSLYNNTVTLSTDFVVGQSNLQFITAVTKAQSNAVVASNTFTGTQTLAVGTTTLAPLKFQNGVVQTTPVAHSVEWDGYNMYTTSISSVRQAVPDGLIFSATLRNQTATAPVSSTSTTMTFASGVQTAIDGHTLISGDVVLNTAQADNKQNGPWVITTLGTASVAAVWTRPAWYQGTIKNGMVFAISRGTNYQGTAYTMHATALGDTDIVVGTTGINPYTVWGSGGNLGKEGGGMSGTITLRGGSTGASTAPMKFTAGGIMTTPEAHAMEWDGTSLYTTTSAATRTTVPALVAGPTGSTGTVPTLSSSNGVAGQMAFDTAYLYVCISSNTWKRATLNAF